MRASILKIALSLSIFFNGYLCIGQTPSEVYSFDKKISIPGNGGYDYLSIDEVNSHLFISHGISVNVLDLHTEQLVGTIDNMKGVHGIAVDNESNKGFISDGDGNSVVVFDLKTFKKIKTIPLTPKDADAILFDPFSKKVFVFCGDGKSASVIDVNLLKEVKVISLDGSPEFAVSDKQGLIYNNLEDKSSLSVIDTKAMKVIHNYPLSPCIGPTGLAIDAKNKRLFTVCRGNKGMSVVDIDNGKVISTLPIGAGVDAVAYDPVTSLVICSNGDGTTTIIKQQSANAYTFVQTLSTQYRAKTMALDYKTHKIYMSTAEFEKGTKKIIPGSFHILVYKLKQA